MELHTVTFLWTGFLLTLCWLLLMTSHWMLTSWMSNWVYLFNCIGQTVAQVGEVLSNGPIWNWCVRIAAINPKRTRAKTKTFLFRRFSFSLRWFWSCLHFFPLNLSERHCTDAHQVWITSFLLWDSFEIWTEQSQLSAAMLMIFVRRRRWKFTRTFWLGWCSMLRILSLKF